MLGNFSEMILLLKDVLYFSKKNKSKKSDWSIKVEEYLVFRKSRTYYFIWHLLIIVFDSVFSHFLLKYI